MAHNIVINIMDFRHLILQLSILEAKISAIIMVEIVSITKITQREELTA